MKYKKTIREFWGEYRWLSNFWRSSVCYDGLWFPTVENAYQAAKEQTRQQRMSYIHVSPKEAKGMGRKADLRSDWENIKFGLMKDLVFQKFYRDENLKQKLLSTGDAQIIEGNTWRDTYWGVCNGVGKNNLGKIIMSIRDLIQ